MKYPVIGISGMPAAGKTTLSQELIKKFNKLVYIEASLIYRAILFNLMKKENLSINQIREKFNELGNEKFEQLLNLKFALSEGELKVLVDDESYTESDLYNLEMDKSNVDFGIAMGDDLNPIIRKLIDTVSMKRPIIVNARRILNLYPNLDVHLLLTSDFNVRAERKANMDECPLNIAIEQLKIRDEKEKNAGFWEISSNTEVIDTTSLSIDETLKNVIKILENKKCLDKIDIENHIENRKKKIAIVYPEVYDIARFEERRKEMPPFGALYLVAVIEENKLGEVTLVKADGKNSEQDFSSFDVVGFSLSSSATYKIMREMNLKSKYKESAIKFIGGLHATVFQERLFDEMDIDIIFVGEAENTIIEVLNSNKQSDLANIKGIIYKDGKNIIKTPKREVIKDLDTIPFPARHLLDEEDFIMNNRLSNTNLRMTHILASRGCSFNCKFCANLNHNVRYRSPANIKTELQMLKDEYGIEGFCITDDNFVVNKKKVIEVCDEVKPLDLKWSALSRIDTVDKETMQKMYDSGCIEIKFGVESGSPQILQAMGKKINPSQIINTIKTASDIGINVKIFLIHGFPGENMQTTDETINLLEQIKPYVDRVSLFRFVPLPGSEVYNNPEKYNLLIKNDKENERFDDFHIYKNENHWWGSKEDFEELEQAYKKIENYIAQKWKEPDMVTIDTER